MRTFLLLCLAAAALALAGCGGDVDKERPRTTSAPPNPAVSLATENVEVTPVEYHGWKALRMSNGLVTLVAVPGIGGRIMEYKLNGHPFLWGNPEEYGRTYPAPQSESERVWRNFGGYKVWPAPQSEWKGPGDPLGSQLDGGPWTGEIVRDVGQTGEIKLTSPADPAVTGLQITRTVKLFAGSTRVEVRETFANVSDRPIRWSVWDVTQVPGSLSDDSPASDESRIYFPLNPRSKHPDGFVRLMDSPAADSQWEALKHLGLLRVSYHHEQGKIGADSMAGWIAHVDEVHNMAFIKRFETEPLAEYPDQGSAVEVYTSGTLPYMEVEVLSPLLDLKPSQERTVVRQWFATALPGPIREAADASAVSQPLTCVAAGEKLKVTGVFGVFTEGSAVLSTADKEGKAAGEIITFPASPVAPLAIAQEIARPKDAASLVLDLRNANGSPVGRLGRVELPQAPEDQVATAGGG